MYEIKRNHIHEAFFFLFFLFFLIFGEVKKKYLQLLLDKLV